MADVLPFRKPGGSGPEDRWSADVRLWNGAEGLMAQVSDSDVREGETRGARLRRIAGEMLIASRLLYEDAEAMEPSEEGTLLATVQIFRSARVRLWCHMDTNRRSGRKWLRKRMRDARDLVDEKGKEVR